MLLRIDDTTAVGDIQTEFNRCFPYLRLEFIELAHDLDGNTQVLQVKNDRLISELPARVVRSTVVIDPLMSVRDLELLLQETLGVRVEVFRQSGQTWLRTMLTHDWTLRYQNEQGAILSALSARESWHPS